MASIRARLTLAYAGALLLTILAFGTALWAARRAAVYRDVEEYVVARANQAVRIIQEASTAGEPLTTALDSLVGPIVSPELRSRLEGVPEYLLVLDASGRLLYSSFEARQLDPDARATVQTAALEIPSAGHGALVGLPGEQVLMVARSDPSFGPGIARVVAGASTRPAQLAPSELVRTMLIVAPFVLLLSVAGGYAIAGRAFRPVDRIINEVEAITDGRSLHRRLPVEEGYDELARLTATLNAMIARLETSFSGLRRFTADASHELKTPLTVLRADVERAMTAPSANEQLIALEEALRETTRMADLVESLLTLARADEGRLDLHREPVELEPLVREVFETATILGEDAGLAVEMPMVDPATVMGDRTRLRQLFLNLITNAIKYTPRGGKVDVSLARSDGLATFIVRDSGVGIAAADLPHIFERFYRADRARSRSSERGWGLGLAISQWIVQAHGGQIFAVSRLGRGSTFTVTLPVADSAASALHGARSRLSAQPADAVLDATAG